MTDLELCNYIDNDLLPRILRQQPNPTIYILPESKRSELADWIWSKYNEVKWKNIPGKIFSSKTINEAQLRRCLDVR